jgi:hypothetical protein
VKLEFKPQSHQKKKKKKVNLYKFLRRTPGIIYCFMMPEVDFRIITLISEKEESV